MTGNGRSLTAPSAYASANRLVVIHFASSAAGEVQSSRLGQTKGTSKRHDRGAAPQARVNGPLRDFELMKFSQRSPKEGFFVGVARVEVGTSRDEDGPSFAQAGFGIFAPGFDERVQYAVVLELLNGGVVGVKGR